MMPECCGPGNGCTCGRTGCPSSCGAACSETIVYHAVDSYFEDMNWYFEPPDLKTVTLYFEQTPKIVNQYSRQPRFTRRLMFSHSGHLPNRARGRMKDK